MRILMRSGVVLAVTVALVGTSIEPRQASAATASPVTQRAVAADGLKNADNVLTDISARRRHRHRGGQAAGLAMMGLMMGTIATIAAERRSRRHYYSYYGHPYGYGPHHYSYYDAPRYYHAPARVYYGHRFHRRHHYHHPHPQPSHEPIYR